MKNKLIVANWKANPESIREAKEIFSPIKRAAAKLNQVEVVICPPAVWLAELVKGARNWNGGVALGSLKATPPFRVRLSFGGQDAFWELIGAYTGQLGPTMIRNAGATYLIIGHSETRALGDTDNLIKAKVRLALKHGLKVILCVGEKARDEHGKYLQILRGQIESALTGVPRTQAKQIILAYEPIWAIGAQAKGADTPAAFLEQSIFLRKVLTGIIGREMALDCSILYGGSVDADNAAGFLDEGGANGLLVGRVSLSPESFIKILKIANSI
jgi:triosephosphate isomerase